ncbi:hypothetical protein KEM55_006258 [Ascosphaera atra]|nr:hypothetical protein KEM55_006258 [Ascosphaera atra]
MYGHFQRECPDTKAHGADKMHMSGSQRLYSLFRTRTDLDWDPAVGNPEAPCNQCVFTAKLKLVIENEEVDTNSLVDSEAEVSTISQSCLNKYVQDPYLMVEGKYVTAGGQTADVYGHRKLLFTMTDSKKRRRRQRLAAFTPLISPDMTPLEHQFRMVPEYTFSGQHLTPLTSPAINAMNMPQAMMQPIHQGFRPNASIAAPQGAPEDHSYNSTEANGSTAMSAQHSAQSSYGHDYASPSIQASTGPTASMSAVAGLPMGVASTQYAPRRTPHQHSMSASSSMRGTAGISRARQSPSILAQKRKKTASEEEQQQTPSSTALAIPEHVESQADPLMPPPALPPPSRRASFPTKPATNASASTAIAAAATPATLMRLSRRRKSTNISASAISPQISPPQPGSAQSLQQVQNDAHFVTPTSTTSTPFMGPPGSDATSVPDETSTILPQMEDIQLPDPAHVDQSITGVATNPSTASHTKPQPVLAPASSQTLNSGTANGNALQSANPTTPNATHYGEGNDRDPYSASASPVTPRSSQHIHAQQQQSQQQTQLQNNVQRDSSTSRPAPKRRESGHTIRHSASGSSTSSGPKRKHSARSLSTIVPKPTGPGPSPAIRPKLSPSIQPSGQLDVASMGYDATTLHLASKSNYQRIIDGTLLPGVSYPETLAENLSSKRTNHKLAEQGRRNRINAALKEIETLIPSTFAQQYSQSKEREKEKNGGNAGSPVISAKSSQPISKASTVEMAIVYIKALQAELGETKQRLDQYEGNFGHNQKEQQQPTQQSAGLDDAVPATEVQSSELSQGVAKASEAG